MPPRIDTLAAKYAAELDPEELAALTAQVQAHAARLRAINECPDPLALAQRHDDHTVATPALRLLASRLVETVQARDGRLVISIAPQQGKSTMLRWLCLWLLADDPTRRITYISYGHELARESGRIVRSLIATYGAELGLAVDRTHADASNWSLDGQPGGMFCTGTGGSLTGRPSDIMIVDDALRGERDADSEIIRARLHAWWESTARTRLAPGAPVVVVGTRWHEQDLSGRLVEEGWPLLNVPALADGRVPDALDRPAGEWLESARGTTVADWEKLRAESGERAFYALMQGAPAPPEGGIFRQAWFDQHRVTTPPELARVEIGVDPADTGTGDAAGVLVAGRAADGHLYVLDDLSDALSRGAWARLVALAAVRHDAACIVSERTLGMQTAVGEAWALIRRQATALSRAGGDVDVALDALLVADDAPAADARQLAELVPLVDDVLDRPSSGPCRVDVVTPRQAKQTRAEAITNYYEVGRCHHVGRLGPLEHEAVTWQPGQPSPNRLDTLAHLLPHLDAASVPARASRPRRRTPTRTFGAPGGGARLAAR